MERRLDPRSVLVAGMCGYEFVAIASGRVPTLTSLAWKARRSWAGRAAVWGVLGYLSWHLLVEEDLVEKVLMPGQP